MGEEISSDEELLSLFEHTRKLISGSDKTVYLGNLVRALPGWIQQRDSEQSNPFRTQAEPTTVKEESFIDELAEQRAREWDEMDRVEEYKQVIGHVYQHVQGVTESDFRAREEEVTQATNTPGVMLPVDAIEMGYESILDYYEEALYREFGIQASKKAEIP